MLDIIDQILDYEAPEGDKNYTCSNKKIVKKSSNNVEMRKLSEDFLEIDLLEFPYYPSCVRRIVDINYIKVSYHFMNYYCNIIVVAIIIIVIKG